MLTGAWAFSQGTSVKGKIADKEQLGLPGAHVVLLLPSGENAKNAFTDADGAFALEGVRPGKYTLKVTFLSYQNLEKEITVERRPLDLGVINLEEEAIALDQVQVTGQAVTGTQRGDTTSFNADAFKVMKDASAEDLVSKMPGVTVENGQVKAQGEDVKQVLVDGKPFFGNDPTAALRNLPAEVIGQIQVFDQRSDQSNFTGFDDGNTSKTLNIVTRGNMRNGQFGKMYAGYGYDDKYRAGGTINFFSGNRRITLIAQSNNINQQNFAAEDLVGALGGGGRGGFGGRGGRGGGGGFGGGGDMGNFLVNEGGGVATTHALGLNYSDKWGKKVEISGSYFFNNSIRNTDQLLDRTFISDAALNELYSQNTDSRTDNFNHRANARIEIKIDSANSIIYRPSLSLQQNNGFSNTFGQTLLGANLLNQTENDYNSDMGGINFNNSLLFRHRFSKPRRTVSLDMSLGYSDRAGESFLYSANSYYTRLVSDSLDQFTDLNVNGWNVSSNLEYTEPAGKNSMVTVNYRISKQLDESSKKTFDHQEGQGYVDSGLNQLLSNVSDNDYTTHQAGIGYNWNKQDIQFNARATMQYADLNNAQSFPTSFDLNRNFLNFVPYASLRYNFTQSKNLRLSYNARTQSPSVEQLQEVIDNSNPLQLSVGNPELDQSYSHNLFLRYSATNTEKATVFFAFVGGTITQDYIAKGTFLANSDNPIFDDLQLQPGAQLTMPVNLDGNYSLRSFMTYGFPLKPIKSTLNFSGNANYARIPGLINDELNYSSSTTLGGGLTISSNISDKLDFSVFSRTNYSFVNNTLQTNANNNYLIQSTGVRFNWQFAKGFVYRTDLSHQAYSGLGEAFNQNYALWNMSLGKKMFKNERGELTLSVFDLLKQNLSISRNVTEVYIEDVQTQVLQQYFMLTFTYNLRNFNGGAQSGNQGQSPMWQGRPGGSGGPPRW